MQWELLFENTAFRVRRSGRFIVAELLRPHRVLSTSSSNGGQQDAIRFLVNHQSCEGSGHRERHAYMTALGLDQYHDTICQDLELPCEQVAMMGTAANMNYATCEQKCGGGVFVTAIVTAGVSGNAACAGDPTTWRETSNGWEKIVATPGTINTMLLFSCSLSDGALARAVITMTEAKSSALQKLAIRSRYSREIATGTTTDQFCIAAPVSVGVPMTSTSTGLELGELIGSAVRDATLEALRWQNGLEPSYTRGIFHALDSYGLKEARFFEEIAPYLSVRELELLRGNIKSVMYEPLVSAAGFAMASILDRLREGVFPASSAREALRQQAAALGASLAACPEYWVELHDALSDVDVENPAPLILKAIALGWSKKWS